tara:strand:- start:1209 stop:1403 length:195 start_codon:yes stop_codon:yes gene_type:complete
MHFKELTIVERTRALGIQNKGKEKNEEKNKKSHSKSFEYVFGSENALKITDTTPKILKTLTLFL